MRSFVLLFILIFGRCSHGQSVYPTGHCLKKICEQVVTGRQLTYGRILQIIHKREYLDAIHVRKGQHRQRRQAAHHASTEVLTQGLNHPLLIGLPLVILSAMFMASLGRRKKQEPEEELPTVEVFVPPEIVIAPPPIPPHLPKPGQPGGGYEPDPYHHHKVLSLVPPGLLPVAVFPAFFNYFGDLSQSTPSECVAFTEPPLPAYAPHHRQRRSHYLPVHPPPPLFGFSCLVTVIDKKVCNSTYQCERIKNYEAVYGHGYFFDDPFHPHYPVSASMYADAHPTSYPTPYYYGRLSKRKVTEFVAHEIPQCRIEDTPHASDCDEAQSS